MTLETLQWLRSYQTDKLILKKTRQHYLDQAERIYYAAISRRWTKPECTIAAKWLQSTYPEAAEYLAWLLTHKMTTWPHVKGNGVKKTTREDVEFQTAKQ